MPWNRSLRLRILAPYLIALLAVAVSVFTFAGGVLDDLSHSILSDGLLSRARLIGEILPHDERGAALDARCRAVGAESGTRITVIGADGTVVGESETSSASMENHRDRPEVRAALQSGDGWSVRTSATTHNSYFYRAWRQDGPTGPRVIRVAEPMDDVVAARSRLVRGLWLGVIVAAIAMLWPAIVWSRRLSNRLDRLAEFSNAVAKGSSPPALVPEDHGTLGRLERDLVAMAGSLSAQLRTARDEQGKLEAVLRGMVEGVLVIDRSGTVRLSNRRAATLFGSTVGALTGLPLINISRDPDLHEVVRGAMAGSEPLPAVREITLDHDGRENLQVTATPIVEPEGPPQLFILVFHDITQLKRLEATRRDFVANVSHELRTPLTAIRGYAETLQSGAIDDPSLARKFVSVIERHSERLGRLIDDLLTLSDLELGRAEVQRVAVALAPLVEAAIDVVSEKATHGKVEVSSELPAELPPVLADPDRLEQVLVNLIDNAVKYTASGGRVVVSAHLASAPTGSGSTGRWVQIRVADTGIGIPSTDLPRLTERFYRVDKARSRQLGGTGLGLAIVKHIVQVHGGALHIESELGRGTTVIVALPVAEGTG